MFKKAAIVLKNRFKNKQNKTNRTSFLGNTKSKYFLKGGFLFAK